MRLVYRFGVLLSSALVSQQVLADLYSAEDFHGGLRAYEAVYGGYRQRSPLMEGAAFEFLGYLKATVDLYNGSSFCLGERAFPKAVAGLVQDYNRHPDWRDRDPKAVVVESFAHAYPCVAGYSGILRP